MRTVHSLLAASAVHPRSAVLRPGRLSIPSGTGISGRTRTAFPRHRFRSKGQSNGAHRLFATTAASPRRVPIQIDGKTFDFSSVLLRDACQCPSCVHRTSRQRLFAHVDIPIDLQAWSVEVNQPSDTVNIKWINDVPGFAQDHTTTLNLSDLRNVVQTGSASGSPVEVLEREKLWPLRPSDIQDFDYGEYMNDDKVLYKLMRQLRVNGLAFVSNSPQNEESVSEIATRMGPIKDTFYGPTWDVRTIPQAINAAYTSSDLGFHTDLLYFQQPPHIQLLHCVQSASSGGASVFTDAHKAAVDLFNADFDAFNILATTPANYHYNHPNDNVYRTQKPVIGMHPLRVGNTVYDYIEDYIKALESRGVEWTEQRLVDCLDKCNWGPPFSAPFSLDEASSHEVEHKGLDPLPLLNTKVDKWYEAAKKFNTLLQRPEYLFERKMDPGDCVLFDNTRTLHSRKAFDQADVGKPRWLRGTYVDKDPYLSKLRVLQNKFGR